MGVFFDKTFKEQVKCIIQSGDLKLLQILIGIRNTIALLQFFASFITTKVSIIDINLHGEYKFQKKWLTNYKKNMERLEEQGMTQGQENSSFSDTTFSDISQVLKEELLTKLLLRETNAQNKTVASICNTDCMRDSISDQDLLSYMSNTEIGNLCLIDRIQVGEMYDAFVQRSHVFFQRILEDMRESISHQDLVSYTRNTEINSLCVIHTEQANAMYNAVVEQSHEFLKEFVEKHPYGSSEQKKEINDEIEYITEKISQQENEITKYRNVLKQIKDRSFLKDWYVQLASTVMKDAKEKDHALHNYFPEDVKQQERFIAKLKKLFIVEVVSRLLKEIVSDRCSDRQFDRLLDILKDQLDDDTKFHYLSFVERTRKSLMEEMNKAGDELTEILQLMISEIKPEKVMKAEQSVLDDILFEAVSQGKKDCALLLICNGANINLQRGKKDKTKINVREKLGKQILDKPGLLVIKKLYHKMLSINARLFSDIYDRSFSEFVVEGASQLDEKCGEFTVNNILSLKEIRNIFPYCSEIKKISDSMVECGKKRLDFESICVAKEKNLDKIEVRWDDDKKKYTKPSWKWFGLFPAVFAPPIFAVYGLASAAAYVAVHLGVCGVAISVNLSEPFLARRNARNELEIAEKDAERATVMFEVLLESLKMSVVAGSDVFRENCMNVQKEIDFMKKSKEKWINFTNVLKAFENAKGAAGPDSAFCFVTESVKFGELAEDIIRNRMSYMNVLLGQSDTPYKSTDQTVIIKNTDNVREEKEKEERRKREEERESEGIYSNAGLNEN